MKTAAEARDIALLSDSKLDSEIAELAAHIAAATARWLLLVAEFDRRGAYGEAGFHDCASWLAWRCSLDPRTAREHVRVARAISELPLITQAFLSGELTYSKVRALTRVAKPHNEETLLMYGQHATAAQLDRICSAYRGALSPDDERRSHYQRRLSYQWQDDESLYVSAHLPAEEGKLFLRALEHAREEAAMAQAPEGDDADRRALEPHSASNADALVTMAESSLASSGTLTGGDRFQLIVHLEGGRAELDDGRSLAEETARRLACDASLVAMRERNGKPLSVGRKTRTIPGAIRRALSARDRTCRFPGCQNHRFTDAHHIEHWADGGETKLSNLVTLCRRHHRLVHEEGYSVEPRRDGFVFRRPNGDRIRDCPALPRAHPRQLPSRNERRGLRVDDQSCFPRSGGERMDLELNVWNLCELDRLADERKRTECEPGGSAEPRAGPEAKAA